MDIFWIAYISLSFVKETVLYAYYVWIHVLCYIGVYLQLRCTNIMLYNNTIWFKSCVNYAGHEEQIIKVKHNCASMSGTISSILISYFFIHLSLGISNVKYQQCL